MKLSDAKEWVLRMKEKGYSFKTINNHKRSFKAAFYTAILTFCTNLANAGMNPKALQYIRGHSNINMTLNYYAHATSDSALAEMERLSIFLSLTLIPWSCASVSRIRLYPMSGCLSCIAPDFSAISSLRESFRLLPWFFHL